MKIANSLTAQTTEGEWNEIHGMRSSVHNEPRAGVIRKISLGDAGIVMQRGPMKAGITLDALIALLEEMEPGLKCPPPPKMKSDDLSPEDLKKFAS